MRRLSVVALLTVVGLAAAAVLTTPSIEAGRPCSLSKGCPNGQFCIQGQCVKTIPCDIVLCAPCPEGFVLFPTNKNCCRCVEEKKPGNK